MLGAFYAICLQAENHVFAVIVHAIMLVIVMLSVIMLSVIMLSVVMLSVIMVSVIMVSVIMVSVIMVNVIMVSDIMVSVIMLKVVAHFLASEAEAVTENPILKIKIFFGFHNFHLFLPFLIIIGKNWSEHFKFLSRNLSKIFFCPYYN
jgi:hypothetical protein